MLPCALLGKTQMTWPLVVFGHVTRCTWLPEAQDSENYFERRGQDGQENRQEG